MSTWKGSLDTWLWHENLISSDLITLPELFVFIAPGWHPGPQSRSSPGRHKSPGNQLLWFYEESENFEVNSTFGHPEPVFQRWLLNALVVQSRGIKINCFNSFWSSLFHIFIKRWQNIAGSANQASHYFHIFTARERMRTNRRRNIYTNKARRGNKYSSPST